MAPVSRSDSRRAKIVSAWRDRALGFKATAFALVGLVNTAIDYGCFFVARSAFERSSSMLAVFGSLARHCCDTPGSIVLIAANIVSWSVAVSASYVMNSSFTFAAESGGRLRWRDFLAFVVSGVAGLIANTSVLVFAAQILDWPLWLAKGAAILVSFVVNFLLSHYLVFRVSHAGDDAGKGA